MLPSVEQFFFHHHSLLTGSQGLLLGRGRRLLLTKCGLREGQEFPDVGESPRVPWLRVRRLLLGPRARGIRPVYAACRLLGFCVGLGSARRGLIIILAPGGVLCAAGVSAGAERWGLNDAFALSAVPCFVLYINRQDVSLWEPPGPLGTMLEASGSFTWG